MPEKRNILFVDDEANVLQGLKRMLRPMRQEWEMAFSQSAPQALETLAGGSFDVIVSDIRMPGMDGAALLTEVMQRYPRMVRIILSGHSSEESTLRSVGVAHQFLAKPCNAETLKQTVAHAFALRSLLADDTLKQTVSQMVSVPSMPALYEELMEELRYPDASAQRIGEIVSQDMGMTTKILQLVNSAFFGIPRRVSSPAHATALLGLETMKALVLSMEIFSQFESTAVEGITPESVQKHSTATAAIAKQIAAAEKVSQELSDATLMAGFLHDVGKLILAQNLPDKYGQINVCARERQIPLYEAEREVLGTTHAEVGAYLLGLWGLPEPIVEAIAFHHRPGKSCGRSFSPLTAVHVANAFMHQQADQGQDGATEGLDVDYLTQLGLADRVDAWRIACQSIVDSNGGDA